MFPSFRFYGPAVLALCFPAAVLLAAPPVSSPDTAWGSAAAFRFNEAYTEFEKLLSENPSDPREIKLGCATTLIGVQPETDSNIGKAAQLCQELITENGEDREGLLAAYLLARIEQFHREPANLEKAKEIYQGLLQKHPESLAARLAVGKLAVLKLYAEDSDPAAKKKFLAELETTLAGMPASAQCETFLVMGSACLTYNLGEEKALQYLIAAEAADIPSVKLQGNTLVQIGLLSQKLGHKEAALKYYQKFITQYKRDTRNYLVRQKIAELQAAP
jgi:tetratricopeptide (TPR) repeat protein